MELREAAAAMSTLCMHLKKHVHETMSAAKAAMLQALGGSDVSTPISESCIRRAFQARHHLWHAFRAVACAS
jgi:hypothetical protein